MMLYPSMNDLLKKVHNRYSLVNVAAKRARDIAAEAEDNPDITLDEKPVSMALADIMSGKIVPVEPPEIAEEGENAEGGDTEDSENQTTEKQ